MEIPVLKVARRQEVGKRPVRKVRTQGLIPAVCYGKGRQPLPLVVDPKQLTTILQSKRGLNSLIRLDGAEDRTVFVQDLQRHPVERNLLHVDFLSVDTERKVQRRVAVELIGRPVGVKLGGLLQLARRRVLVEALPTQLPASVKVDVGNLQIGDVIHVADLDMPEGVRAVFERNFTICAVVAPTVEEKTEKEKAAEEAEEEAAAQAEAKSAPEAEKKVADEAK